MNAKRNGEIIGFKVPGKALILLCHVDDYICQRIGITIKILLLQAGLDEGIEDGKIMKYTQWTCRQKIICRNESNRTVIKAAELIRSFQRRIICREIGTLAVKGPMRTGRSRISVCRQQGDGSLVQKAFQNRTTIGGKLDMDILDKGIARWPALIDLKL